MTSQNVNMMNYISENVAVAGQSGVIERRNFYQVFISLSLLFIPVLALYFFSGMNAQQEYKMQVLRSEVISIAKENATGKNPKYCGNTTWYASCYKCYLWTYGDRRQKAENKRLS